MALPKSSVTPVVQIAVQTPNQKVNKTPTFIPWKPTTPVPVSLPSSKPTPPITKGIQLAVNPSPNDKTAPVISALIEENLSRGSVSIQWTTDEIATSQVEYGLTPQYGKKTTQNRGFSLYHAALLSDLKDNTTYYYRVISRDQSGNTKTSSGYSFKTPPSPVGEATVSPIVTPSSTPTPSPTPSLSTPTPTLTPTITPSPTPSIPAFTPIPTPAYYVPSPVTTPTASPESSPVSVLPGEFSQTATLWDATLKFFGAKR
jgi:hypothetical protein